MSQHPKYHGASQRGYALLVTLVLLALLGVILGGMARRSADTALQARDAEQAMRQHWAKLSCSHTLLSSAPERGNDRLKAWQSDQEDAVASIDTERPSRYETFSLKLAGVEILGRIDDEQSKINLNERLRTSPDAAVMPSAVVDEILSPTRSAGLQLTRQPFVQALGLQPLMSWQQVLPGYAPEQLLSIDHPDRLYVSAKSQAPADRVTLWGDGTINLWTAEDQVVRQRLNDIVQPTTIESVLQLRAQEPPLPLGTLYENATEDQGERAALGRVFSDRSVCYSLWLAVRAEGQEQAAYRWSLRVLEKGGNQESGRLREYRW